MELVLGLIGAAILALVTLRRPRRSYWLLPALGFLLVGSVLWAWGEGLGDNCVPDCGAGVSVSGTIAAVLIYAFVGLLAFVFLSWVYRRLVGRQVSHGG